MDERDQHIVTSINSLSCEAWDESYGKIYKSLIDAGLLSIMVGQIALPAYEKEFGQGTEIILSLIHIFWCMETEPGFSDYYVSGILERGFFGLDHRKYGKNCEKGSERCAGR